MAMSDIVALGLIGAAGYWAYKRGFVVELGEASPDAIEATEAPAVETPPTTDDTENLTKEESLLVKYSAYCSGWSKDHREVTAALMNVESVGREKALGPIIKKGMHKGHRAHGCMQVMPITVRDIYDNGYQLFEPTRANLLTYAGGIYFGTAYLEMIGKNFEDPFEVCHAYHGGPGWRRLKPGNPNYTKNQNYVKKIRARYGVILAKKGIAA